MYSESDIEAAVASGALTPEAAAALRASVAQNRASPLVDEESFRLITGFNDIFVSIAAILLLVAVGWIGSSIGGAFLPAPLSPEIDPFGPEQAAFQRHMAASALFGGAFVAATSWMLAEYFTRARRMALPSILLLATFALGTAGALFGLVQVIMPGLRDQAAATSAAFVGICTAGAIYLHWRRFHVPITIAALTGALVSTVISLTFAAVPALLNAWLWMLLGSGLCVFAFAMWWDMSDRTRTTRRSDVAFWLHLAAAPMIAHPIFWLLGVMNGEVNAGTALVVIGLYVLFGIVALAIDRRALLVSSLFYVLYAMEALFKQFGAVSLNVALTGLVIGSLLLMLSAFWHVARRVVVSKLPLDWQAKLPALDRPVVVTPRPA
ncbi:MFS family permease [Sphingomonas vulcanisoli]|uniref:MFS family permease n=1 Tax=Sphingomonas vulcanisoli TaxID=1658060 RepID=A0ABX0TNS3_9SPHN|nr:hypothetical protein [Sphingomonas vulcanisoli]NIJ07171.1 MFS family permease [Sphingomonas vulcanisoli]